MSVGSASLPWHENVDLRRLLTPLSNCVFLPPGPVDAPIVKELEDRGFDQAPVQSSDGAVLGIIETTAARSLLASSKPIEPEALAQDRLGIGTSLQRLLEALSEVRAALVYDDAEGLDSQCLGLITRSDLNRHYLRAVIYGILAELEEGLANLVDKQFPDPWAWLGRLDDETQARLAGYWIISQRRNVDIGPVTGATLSQLLNIVSRSPELVERLGYSSGKGFKDETRHVPEIRNRIMHPVRPMVLEMEDVTLLKTTLATVTALTAKLRAVA
jgi:hypothetical protein